MAVQTVEQRDEVNRRIHVWKRHGKGKFKCVLCGGVDRHPTESGLPEYFEKLTQEERELCPRSYK